MNKKAFTLVETIIAVAISVTILITAIMVWIQSSSSITKGQADLSNLYESGRIFSLIRKDLSSALYLEPPFSTNGDSGYDTIEFKTIIEEISSDPITIKWSYNSSKRVVNRIINGKKYEYGRGKISGFNTKILLFPETNDLKEAQKACVELIIEMAPKTGKIEEGNKLAYSHIITPFNFNLYLKSKYNFK